MLEPLMPLLRSANGFMSHAGGRSPAGGMRIIEIWESEADQKEFFDENLKANLPPGLAPDLTYYELHAGFTR
jgi:nanoRNase/pAp phosphatase (c-di-AMP/oligoRNAs hydrolase)